METAQKTKEVNILKVDFQDLPAYRGAKEKQNALVKDNPFVTIEDAQTYETAKKRRTALRQGRFDLQNGEKSIASKLKDFREFVKKETSKLIAITQPHEDKQQAEIDRYEKIKAEEKAEKERIENERLEKIRNHIVNFRETFTTRILTATLKNIVEVETDFEAINVDCEEFQQDFNLIKETLSEQLSQKKDQLNEAERNRVENERIESEKKQFELEKSRFSELKKYNHIYEGEDLGTMPEKQYEAIRELQKGIFEDAKRKEITKRIDKVLKTGFSFEPKSQRFTLGKQVIEYSEVEEHSDFPKFLNEIKQIAKSETTYLESIKPDKEKLKELIESTRVTALTEQTKFKTDAAHELYVDYVQKMRALMDNYINRVDTL